MNRHGVDARAARVDGRTAVRAAASGLRGDGYRDRPPRGREGQRVERSHLRPLAARSRVLVERAAETHAEHEDDAGAEQEQHAPAEHTPPAGRRA